MDDQAKFEAQNRAFKATELGEPRGMGWGGRWEGAQEGGTCVHPWLIHVNVWWNPPQYRKVISFQLNKLIFRKRSAKNNNNL